MSSKKGSRDSYTREDGSPNRPWKDDDDVVEAEFHPMGAPVRGIEAPRDMERNTLTVKDVAGERFHLEGQPTLRLKPHIESLLSDGFSVAQLILARQRKVLIDEDDFDASDVTAYSKVVDAVAKLAREERAQEATLAAQDMTDEELEAYLSDAIEKGLLGPGKDEDEVS